MTPLYELANQIQAVKDSAKTSEKTSQDTNHKLAQMQSDLVHRILEGETLGDANHDAVCLTFGQYVPPTHDAVTVTREFIYNWIQPHVGKGFIDIKNEPKTIRHVMMPRPGRENLTIDKQTYHLGVIAGNPDVVLDRSGPSLIEWPGRADGPRMRIPLHDGVLYTSSTPRKTDGGIWEQHPQPISHYEISYIDFFNRLAEIKIPSNDLADITLRNPVHLPLVVKKFFIDVELFHPHILEQLRSGLGLVGYSTEFMTDELCAVFYDLKTQNACIPEHTRHQFMYRQGVVMDHLLGQALSLQYQLLSRSLSNETVQAMSKSKSDDAHMPRASILRDELQRIVDIGQRYAQRHPGYRSKLVWGSPLDFGKIIQNMDTVLAFERVDTPPPATPTKTAVIS